MGVQFPQWVFYTKMIIVNPMKKSTLISEKRFERDIRILSRQVDWSKYEYIYPIERGGNNVLNKLIDVLSGEQLSNKKVIYGIYKHELMDSQTIILDDVVASGRTLYERLGDNILQYKYDVFAPYLMFYALRIEIKGKLFYHKRMNNFIDLYYEKDSRYFDRDHLKLKLWKKKYEFERTCSSVG